MKYLETILNLAAYEKNLQMDVFIVLKTLCTTLDFLTCKNLHT